ncbi:MAG: phage tail tape measure protein [Vulcanimicrobiaceae bacterium]
MPLGTSDLAVNIRVVATDFIAGMGKVTGAVKTFGAETDASLAKIEQRTENLSHVWRSLLEAFIGIEIVNGLRKVAEMANSASENLDLAARNAKNFGTSFDPRPMEQWIKQFAASAEGGGYAISDMNAAAQKFTSVGLDEAQTMRAIADATNLAAARNMSLATATQVVEYAMTGHIEMLTRYGIVSREAAKHIHTVAEAMALLEKHTSGAAAARAALLAGSFGLLSNALWKLGASFGTYLIPYFAAAANGIANLADAFDRMPAWMKKAATAAGVFTLGLMAIVLLLPALVKAFAFAGDGLGLFTDFLGIAGSAAKLLYGIFVGPLIEAFAGLVSYARTATLALFGMADAEDSVAAGMLADVSPILLVIAAIVGLVAAVVELTGHWSSAMKFLNTAWDEFYNNVLHKAGALQRVLADLALALSPGASGMVGRNLLAAELAVDMPQTSASFGAGLSNATNAVMNAVKGAIGGIGKFFSSAFGLAPTIPNAAFTGIIPGKSGKGAAGKALNDAITQAKDAIEAPVTAAAAAVGHAKANAEAAATNLDTFNQKYKGQPVTANKLAEEHRLVNAQLERELQLRAALAQQRQAEITAAERYRKLAESLPASDKSRVAHASSLEKMASAHLAKASALRYAWEHIADAINKAHAAETAYDNQLNLQTYTGQRQALDVGYAQQSSQAATAAEHQRFEAALAKVRGESPAQSARYDVQAAQLAQAAAQDKVAYLEHALVLDAAITDAKTRDAKETADKKSLSAASLNAAKALDATALAVEKLKVAAGSAEHSALQKVLGRIPGMHVSPENKISFNPMDALWTILGDAASKSKAFGDIMQTVTEIVSMFAQIIDAFRPVIDLLLKGVLMVANGFIMLWNTIAHILSLFGIHIGYLQKLNTALGGLTPFLTIVHDIPTLNELATGNVAPLYPKGAHDTVISQWNQPLIDTMNSPNLGGGLLGTLVEILGGIMALKWAMTLFGGSGGGGIIGAIEGVVGVIAHFFGGGGSIGAAGIGVGGGTGLWGSVLGSGSSSSSSGIAGLLGKFGLNFGSGTNGTALLGTLGTLAGGALIGGFMGGLEGGGTHTDFGAIGGALGVAGAGALFAGMGGLAGLVAAGPAGWAVLLGAAVLGGAAGGLFGHKDNPAQMPDKYNTASWGQGLADLQGSGVDNGVMNANGQQFTENSQLAQSLGNQGELGFISSWIAAHAGKASSVLGPLAAIFTGVGDKGIVNGKNGTLDLANGVTINWQTLISDAQQAISEIGQGFAGLGTAVGGNISAIAGNITRFISASTNELAGSVPSAAPISSVGLQSTGAQQAAPGSFGDPAAHGILPPMQNHFYGDIHGYNDVELIGKDLAEATARYERMSIWRLDRTAWGMN